MGLGDEYDVDPVEGERPRKEVETLGVFLPDWAAEDATFLGWLDRQEEYTLQEALGYSSEDIEELAEAYADAARPEYDDPGTAAAVERVTPYVAQRGVDPEMLLTDLRKWQLQQAASWLWGGAAYERVVENDALRYAVERCLIDEHAPDHAELDAMVERYFDWTAELDRQLEETRREAEQEAIKNLFEDNEAIKDLLDDAFTQGNHAPRQDDASINAAPDTLLEEQRLLIGPVGSGKTDGDAFQSEAEDGDTPWERNRP